MSTPLIALAVILAVFAVVLIPLMMAKSGQEPIDEPRHEHGSQAKKSHRKKKRR
ncbi:hypothetical protein GEOBRER4_n0538 [Citrifermentans bremense]|uniref:Uncharacterized protein n=1 Tax=Citrifermentans bremense TaxID=60035 RepID=A0A7R7FSD6_9BACT|nr:MULTISPECIES: hypothetical protein [Geobacteraceae]BCO11184.1 hypothetical protein GEOBRER4_n0538 [Citrifermentans bremense]